LESHTSQKFRRPSDLRMQQPPLMASGDLPVFQFLIFEKMFLPIFIAILLGFVSPSGSSTANCNNNTTVTTQDNPPGEGIPGDDGTGGPGPGGDQGHIPPPPNP
jgi:hypothetical protein